ncbi:MAG: hypothetical protein QOE14_1423 [Humisphaera sp.]|nr:hypothetical protein [Humisphaera sp.]
MLFLGICLLGYALAGRGFAYVGYPPIFIGEVLLLVGLSAFLITAGWMRVVRLPPALTALPLVLLGAIRLLPSLPEYGIEAARDAVVWAYAAFAITVASLIVSRPERLKTLIARYQLFTKIFLLGIPIAFVVYRFAGPYLPQWPGSFSPVIQVKEGDVLVHLAGILAFWMADAKRNVRLFWAIALTVNMAMMGVIDRAGVVSFGAVMIICLLAKPFHGAAWRTIAMLLLGVVLLWASAIKIEVPGGKGRSISWQQFYVNFVSIFGTAEGGLESNKEWRLNWWGDIVDYTVNGKYFWHGKGFGINLADDDGYQVQRNNRLRSPHNIHMTVLARMGVPGAVAWVVMHGVWLYCIGRAYRIARRRKEEQWAGLFLFLFAYYAAFMINGSFDVFIEGPMGGVWFWTIFGTGLGALWCYRYRRDLFTDDSTDPDDNGGQPQQQTNESAPRTQLLPAAGWRRPGLPFGAGASRIARP